MSTDTPKTMWVVLKAQVWSAIETMGHPLQAPKDGPERFLPVFYDREKALQWAGSEKYLCEITPDPSTES